MNADDVRRAAGWKERHPALAVHCPACKAPVGQRCRTPSGKHILPDPHPGRLKAAESSPQLAEVVSLASRRTSHPTADRSA